MNRLGPIIVLGRPHSGSRLLTGLLRAGGVFVGADLTQPQLDSWGMHQRFVLPLLQTRLTAGDRVPPARLDQFARERYADARRRYADPGTRAWGWKVCETSFVMPRVRRLLPSSVFVHLLRDGRDVVLSDRGHYQITAPTSDPPGWRPAPPLCPANSPGLDYREFSRLVTFAAPGMRSWRGIDLDDPLDLARNRYLLQMRAWVTAVTWARREGSGLGGYHEVRYEDLCRAPGDTARRLFRRLGLPWSPSAAAFLDQHVTTTRIGKWRQARFSGNETADFTRAAQLAAPVLRECGYAG